jgi:hypothetical protein
MRTRVTIATHDRHSWLRQSQLRPNYMNNTLLGGIDIKKPNIELAAVSTQCFDLSGCD